ncbi:hypothetical protein DdX_14010 [Ditylenchus destructor]|uniref:Uncharacterized protein n=1 Tax=Ditylenchus destructor TaxID=166010 RepID=A0AAD4R227_9BILA|nr:hypothetical protein DdX_14010 [Ditylenchus destructor]
MYDKWLSDNSRSSNADISIKAFITYCRSSDPALFVNLSTNANIDCDALIDAFENGTILDENAAIDDTGACSAVNVTDTGEKKKRGRPKGTNRIRFKNSVNLKKTIVQSNNRKDKYYSNETPERVKIRRSKRNEWDIYTSVDTLSRDNNLQRQRQECGLQGTAAQQNSGYAALHTTSMLLEIPLISVAACDFSSLYTSHQITIFRLLPKPSTFSLPFHARHHCSVSRMKNCANFANFVSQSFIRSAIGPLNYGPLIRSTSLSFV